MRQAKLEGNVSKVRSEHFKSLRSEVDRLRNRLVDQTVDLNDLRLRLVQNDSDREAAFYRYETLQAGYNREHNIAEALQCTMLPTVEPDSLRGLTVATLYQAAREEARVGGDFYDVYRMPADEVVLLVGDISGKGLLAARYTVELRTAIRMALWSRHDVPQAMDLVNDYLIELQRLGKEEELNHFATLALCHLDVTRRRATFCIAGAEKPLLIRADGRYFWEKGENIPLGVVPYAFTVTHRRLRTGDTLVLMTDGISEARNGDAFFGGDAVMKIAVASAVARETPQMTADRIFQTAERFASGHLQDDACLVVARVG